jgi:selenocysteine lyase/cysteine desulfurase
MPAPVVDAVVDHLRLEAEIGGYEAFDARKDRYAETYAALSDLLGADGPDEIALVENATRAWDMVFYGFDFGPGDRIVTAQASYASNVLAMLQVRKRTGCELVVVGNDAHGQVDLDALEAELGRGAALLCLTHIPTNGGLVNPAADAGRIARAAGVPYLLDACQSVGQVPLDVREIGCDFLSGTGRKYLRGPRGTGFLYARRESMTMFEPPFLDLHAATWTAAGDYAVHEDARRYETWEGFVAGKIGLGAAVRYALEIGQPAIWDRLRGLAGDLRDGLSAIEGVTVHDIGRIKGGIVTFSHVDVPAGTIERDLLERRINVKQSSPDWSRLDAERRGLPVMIRASVHAYNSGDEIERFLEAVREIVSR